MKNGTDLQTLASRIVAESAAKKDYALDTRKLEFTEEGLVFNVPNKDLPGTGERVTVKPTALCLGQIGTHLGIPAKYVQRMHEKSPALLATNINHWFQNEHSTRMLRTLQNGKMEARAFLSQKYRPLDNFDLMNAILPKLQDSGCEIKSIELTDTRLYIQAVTPKLEGEIKKGDVVQSGIVISNSEVGCGSVKVEPMIYRLVCTNGMITSNSLRKHHVGRAGEGMWDSGDAFEVFSDKTRQLDDRAFWAKVNDVVDASFSEIHFGKEIARLQESLKIDTGNPIEATELVTERFNLFESEKENVLMHLSRGGDLSLWGLANAVTRSAEDCESYDRAIELERIGGQVIELPKTIWHSK